MFRNVVVGISGGIDSAISAFLLKKKGFNVLGIFMKNWDESDEISSCNGEQDLRDAEYTCRKLNIELCQINYIKDYWNLVFANFLDDYQNGLTPNPDILCNKYIKFNLFHKHAIEELKYDAIATGHYAKTNYGPYLEDYEEHKEVKLLIPKDILKDQTFFLSGINRNTLKRTMFPLANFCKHEVKILARKCGLERLCKKKESSGICFIGNRNFKNFIQQYISSKSGDFVNIDNGQIVGKHDGIHQWTLGQRCRLPSFLKPFYVAQKDVLTNTIYVASGHDHPSLFNNKIFITQANWLCSDPFKETDTVLKCYFRFQHTKPLVNCIVYSANDKNQQPNNLVVLLKTHLRAITPGQYAAFYNDTDCLGCARIIQSTRHMEK